MRRPVKFCRRLRAASAEASEDLDGGMGMVSLAAPAGLPGTASQ
jgi:hypothetical protein